MVRPTTQFPSAIHQQDAHSRKRAAPSSCTSRRAWGVVSVAMALSVSSVVAFQSKLPMRHGRGAVLVCTAPNVVTDPNNLVQIEKRKSIVDRAALEELYMLSLTAEAEMATKGKRRRRKIKEEPTSPRKVTLKGRSQTERSGTFALRASDDEAAEMSDVKIETIPPSTEADETRTPSPSSTKTPRFIGLTTGPNRRNQHQNSLSSASPVTRNPTLCQDMQESKTNKERTVTPITYEDLTVTEEKTLSRPQKSRSSTMPGYNSRGDTLRQRAYRNGVKLAEQRSGKKFVESSKAKKKRLAANGHTMYKNSVSVPDSLVRFASEIHDVDRITPKEEMELGAKTQEAIKLQKIYDGLSGKLGREPTDDEWCAAAGKINMEALTQAIDDGLEAKNKLVTSNLRMVQGVVNVYIRNGLQGQYNAGDLMQEGIMALIRAAEKFDPSRGFRFSTYAMYWIRSAVKRDQIYQSRVITIPQRLYENHKRIAKIRKVLTDANERAPTLAQLSEAVGMSEIQIERSDAAMAQKIHSLDQTIFNSLKPNKSFEDKENLYSVIESKTDDSYASRVEYQLFREDLVKALHSHLSDEEAKLLMLRYGLIEDKKRIHNSGLRTIAEVSRLAGLKPDKVRRILNRSLKQLEAVLGDDWRDYEREFEARFE